MRIRQVSTWFANARRRLKKENKMQWSPRQRSGDEDDDVDDDADDDDEDDVVEADSARHDVTADSDDDVTSSYLGITTFSIIIIITTQRICLFEKMTGRILIQVSTVKI